MKLPNFQETIIVLLVLVTCISCSTPAGYERPKDTWVFRSVIDRQPRMLTVALNKDFPAPALQDIRRPDISGVCNDALQSFIR